MTAFRGWFTIREFDRTEYNWYECLTCGKKIKKYEVYIDRTMPQAYGVSKDLCHLPCVCKNCEKKVIVEYSHEHESVKCKRCNNGFIEEYNHIKGGKCFTCNGTGMVTKYKIIPIDELEVINREECYSAVMGDFGFESPHEVDEYFDFLDTFDGGDMW